MSSMMSYKGHRGCGNLLLLLVSEPEFVNLARSIVYKPYRNRESGRRPFRIRLRYTVTENPTARARSTLYVLSGAVNSSATAHQSSSSLACSLVGIRDPPPKFIIIFLLSVSVEQVQ
jgi:hypothetical protein